MSPKKKNMHWKTEPNENKAPDPPCGNHHSGKCRVSSECPLTVKKVKL